MPYVLPLMEDVTVDSHEIWWHVKHLQALRVYILENLLLIRLERRKDFAVRAEFEIGFDLEFGDPRWRGEMVTLVLLKSCLQETPGRWSVETEGNLRGVSKTRGDLCLKYCSHIEDPVLVSIKFRSIKESITQKSQNSNEMNNDTWNTWTRGTLLQRSTLQLGIRVDMKKNFNWKMGTRRFVIQ